MAPQTLNQKTGSVALELQLEYPELQNEHYTEEIRNIRHHLQVCLDTIEIQKRQLQQNRVAKDLAKARFKAFYDLVPVGYCTLSPTGVFLKVSYAMASFLGIERDALIGMDFLQFVVVDDHDILAHCFKTIQQSGLQQSCEVRMLGVWESLWVRIECHQETDAGVLGDFCLEVHHKTDHLLASEIINASRRQFSNIIEFLPNATMAIDKDRRIILWNNAMEKMTGIPAAQMMGKGDLAYTLPFYGKPQKGLLDWVMEKCADNNTNNRPIYVEEDGDIFTAEIFCQGLYDGKGAWIFAKAVPLRDDRGEITGVIQSVRDISARKLAELYRNLANEILQILNEPGDVSSAVRRVVTEVKMRTGIEALGIRLENGNDYPYLAHEGFDDDFLRAENTLFEQGIVETPDGNISGTRRLVCACGMVLCGETPSGYPCLSQGGSFWTNDSLPLLDISPGDDPRYHPRNHCIYKGYRSLALIPIRSRSRIVGLLQLNDRRKNCFTSETIGLLENITSHVGQALMRKQTEAALKKSELRYATTLSVLETGLWEWRLPGGEANFSSVFCRILGYADAEFIPTYEFWRNLVHPEDIEEVENRIKNSLARNHGFGLDLRMRTKRNGWKWVSFRGKPLKENHEKCSGRMVGTLSDITNRKMAEEEKAAMQSQLQHAQKMETIGTLAGGIAHDFNNILTAIMGYTEIVKLSVPADSLSGKNLEQVLIASHRAKDLVGQILTFSRRSEAKKNFIDSAMEVEEACRLLRSTLPTSIALIIDLNPSAGFLLAAPVQIHQIVMNLCTNAMHALEKNGGTIFVTLNRGRLPPNTLITGQAESEKQYIQLTVTDDGTGIDPKIQDRIFDPYFTTKAVNKGTGMGLATVHGIVKSYGGTIFCNSIPGQGTTFHVYLPIVSTLPHQSQEVTSKSESASPGGKEHILLIDDEPMIAEMSQILLQRLGYKVTTKTRSLDALAVFQQQPGAYDLVITDLTMPEMTGIALAQSLLLTRPEIPIILCTGYSKVISEEQVLSMGIRAFIQKPVSMHELASLIRKVLST